MCIHPTPKSIPPKAAKDKVDQDKVDQDKVDQDKVVDAAKALQNPAPQPQVAPTTPVGVHV